MPERFARWRRARRHGRQTRTCNARASRLHAAGLKGRCPRCGEGALFRTGLTLREQAASAAVSSYAFADSGDGPAVFAIFILGFLVLGGALLVEFRLDPPVWVHVRAVGAR